MGNANDGFNCLKHMLWRIIVRNRTGNANGAVRNQPDSRFSFHVLGACDGQGDGAEALPQGRSWGDLAGAKVRDTGEWDGATRLGAAPSCANRGIELPPMRKMRYVGGHWRASTGSRVTPNFSICEICVLERPASGPSLRPVSLKMRSANAMLGERSPRAIWLAYPLPIPMPLKSS